MLAIIGDDGEPVNIFHKVIRMFIYGHYLWCVILFRSSNYLIPAIIATKTVNRLLYGVDICLLGWSRLSADHRR